MMESYGLGNVNVREYNIMGTIEQDRRITYLLANTSGDNIEEIHGIMDMDYNQDLFEWCIKNNFSEPVEKVIDQYSKIAHDDIIRILWRRVQGTFVIPDDIKKN